ncbi:MAG: heme-binding protein [Gammaproteobacteria bacterium]|nr:heme-binding protein [Gammaproteobacteria bacterium]
MQEAGFQVAVAVVDRFGNLISFLRDPLSGSHTITIAKRKAFTASSFQGATIDLADRLSFLKGTPGLSLVGGGVPIRVGGYVYGAVGVSGAPREKIPGDIDDTCAREGIASVQETLEFADM